jgi:cell division protein FtsW
VLEAAIARGGGARRSAGTVLLCALGLSVLGVLIQVAVIDPARPSTYERPWRQAAYLAAAILIALGAAAAGYRAALKWSRPALWITWAMLAVLLLPGMPDRNGSRRWIELGLIHIQPSELAKPVLVLFLASWADRMGDRLAAFWTGFVPSLLYIVVTAALVLLEPDHGQTLFLVAVWGMVLLVHGQPFRHFLPIGLLGLPVFLALSSEKWAYVRARFEKFAEGTHYQVLQGQAAFARGGLSGEGLGELRARLHVPEVHNDFALAAVGEQFGLLGSLGVVLLFIVLGWHGLRIAFLARDRRGFAVAFGMAFIIVLQAAVNMAVVTGVVPPKGIPLPFVSYGGSSLLVLGLAVGLLVSVARDARTPRELAAQLVREARSRPALHGLPIPTKTSGSGGLA